MKIEDMTCEQIVARIDELERQNAAGWGAGVAARTEEIQDLKAELARGFPIKSFRPPLLNERQQTHGDFVKNAEISQYLKTFFYQYRVDNAVQREALDMIALKLSRILSGKADHKDHWDDIAGYAKLASETCNEEMPTDQLPQTRHKS